MLCSMLPVHKAVVAGQARAQPLFWRSMLSAVSLLLVSTHFALRLPFIDAIIYNTRCACKTIEKL